jgi:hypothetical protein
MEIMINALSDRNLIDSNIKNNKFGGQNPEISQNSIKTLINNTLD